VERRAQAAQLRCRGEDQSGCEEWELLVVPKMFFRDFEPSIDALAED